MESVAQALLDELERTARRCATIPPRCGRLVDQHLLPHFDTDYAGQLVLGKHWRQATAAQRKRFVDAFYQSLMRNYGEALLEFTADRMKILPFKGDPNASSATVRTLVRRSNGTPVPVNYSLRKTPSGWKAWDVTIEGISYVKNYRNDFGAEVAQKGLDSVIQRLEAQNATPKPRRRRAGQGRDDDRRMSDCSIDSAAPGRLTVRGDLDFDNAPAALARGLALLGDAKDCEIDLSGLARVTARVSPCSSNGSRARGGGARRCATREFRPRCAPSRGSRSSRIC